MCLEQRKKYVRSNKDSNPGPGNLSVGALTNTAIWQWHIPCKEMSSTDTKGDFT